MCGVGVVPHRPTKIKEKQRWIGSELHPDQIVNTVQQARWIIPLETVVHHVEIFLHLSFILLSHKTHNSPVAVSTCLVTKYSVGHLRENSLLPIAKGLKIQVWLKRAWQR